MVEETLILTDADGNITEDRDQAVGGEVVQQLEDGTTRSTLFTLDHDAATDS